MINKLNNNQYAQGELAGHETTSIYSIFLPYNTKLSTALRMVLPEFIGTCCRGES